MRINSISAENFLSFKKLDYSFPDAGLFFIGGKKIDSKMSISNGAGKSAFTEALCWGLFGKTVRNIGKDEVVNWYVKKDCSVAVSITDEHKREWSIVRFQKHTETGNSLFLFQDKDDLTGATMASTQASIDHMLGMNWLVFSTAIIFGEKAKRFAEAQEADKKKIFDEIMMMQRFIQAQKGVKEDLSRLETKEEIKLGVINSSIPLLEKLKKENQEFDEDFKRYEQRQEDLNKEEISLQKRLEKSQAELQKSEKRLVTLNKELLQCYKNEKTSYEVLVEIKNEKNSAVRDFQIEFEKEGKHVAYAEVELDRANRGLTHFEKLKPGQKCIECKQVLTEENAKKILRQYVSQQERWEKSLNEHSDEYFKLKKKVADVEASFEDRYEEASIKHSDLSGDAKTKDVEKDALKDKIDDIKERIEIDDEQKNNLFDELVDDFEVLGKKRKNNRKHTQETERLVEVAKQERKEIASEKRYLDFWIDGFGNKGIKSFLLDEVIPFLNTKVSYYASALLDDQITIEFDTTMTLKSGDSREKFNVRILKGDDEEIQYKNCSSGERGRLDTAILLALQNLILNRSIGSTNIIILDEIFEHLDSVGIERVINLLSEESKDKAIFVISHQNELQDYFENIILIRNKNGISTLEE